MRILVLTNLYPPLGLGGYEVAAAEVVDGLRARGHDVWVLVTDWRRAEAPRSEHRVARVLKSRSAFGQIVPWLVQSGSWEVRDDRRARAALEEAKPDVVFVWNVGGVSHRVLTRLMNGRVPAVVYVFGDWPLRKYLAPHALDGWTSFFAPRAEPAPRRLARASLRLLSGVVGLHPRAAPLRFCHLEFGSRFLADTFHRAGLVAARSERVIYYGLFGDFARAATEPPVRAAATTSVLFAGRLWESKGVHTLIEAVALLSAQGGPSLSVSVVGPAEDPEYAERLKRQAAAAGLADRVRWVGAVPRESLLAVYRAHDILVFPSIYPEPFGIVQLEAMAAGCVVVGTGTGGSAEILEDGSNALCFRPGDAAQLAERLARLCGDPGLAERLRRGGQRTVRERFVGTRMVDQVEAHLADVVAGGIA